MNADPLQVRVDLGPRSYEIHVHSGREAELGPIVREVLSKSWAGRACGRALVVTDANVKPYGENAVECLRGVGLEPALAVVPAGEPSKSLEQSERLFLRLIGLPADRHTLVVAVGGAWWAIWQASSRRPSPRHPLVHGSDLAAGPGG